MFMYHVYLSNVKVSSMEPCMVCMERVYCSAQSQNSPNKTCNQTRYVEIFWDEIISVVNTMLCRCFIYTFFLSCRKSMFDENDYARMDKIHSNEENKEGFD